MRGYDWFRFHLRKKDDGNGYLIHITSFLDAQGTTEDFVPPFNEAQTNELLPQIEASLRESRPDAITTESFRMKVSLRKDLDEWSLHVKNEDASRALSRFLIAVNELRARLAPFEYPNIEVSD